MIHYSIDSDWRIVAYGTIAGVAVAMQWIISHFVSFFQTNWGVALASPTAALLFSGLSAVYVYLWNFRFCGVPLSPIPDFSGVWIGYINRRKEFVQNGDQFEIKIQELIAVELRITQTYHKISIRLKAEVLLDDGIKGQESECTSAAVFCQNRANPKLQYIWTRQDLSGEGEFVLKRIGSRMILDGRYSSNYPRLGVMELTRCEVGEIWHCGELISLRDGEGRPYLGVNTPEEKLASILETMRAMLGEERFQSYRQSQFVRDGGGFHMTVFDPQETERLGGESLRQVAQRTWLWIRIIGLGRQTRNSEETFYAVAECSGAQQLRAKHGFGLKDMHVTLGFLNSDIHDVPKGVSTIVWRV